MCTAHNYLAKNYYLANNYANRIYKVAPKYMAVLLNHEHQRQQTDHSSRVAGSIPVDGLSAKYSWCLTFTPYCSRKCEELIRESQFQVSTYGPKSSQKNVQLPEEHKCNKSMFALNKITLILNRPPSIMN